MTDRKEQFEFLIGIGKSVKGYHDLKDSFEDSKTAIEYIDVIRKITGDIEVSSGLFKIRILSCFYKY